LLVQKRVEDGVQRAVAAIGLGYGPVHGRVRANNDGVWPLEVVPGLPSNLNLSSACQTNDSSDSTTNLEELILHNAVI
jgi:hypothetical protein